MSAPTTRRQLDQAIQREVGGLHDRYWEEQRQAARGKTVVLVEGDDDADVLGIVFEQRRRTWDVTTRIIAAGGRLQLLERFDMFPNVHGLVDRDTWTDDEVTQAKRRYPRLQVTEGWCLENVFLSPRWLRGVDAQVVAEIGRERERWVRAGALWWCLQRAREAQQSWQEALGWWYGAPHPDLDVSSGARLAAGLTAKIPEEVRRVATFDVQEIADAFDERCREVLGADEETQWRIGVHGKKAFRALLVPALTRASGQLSWSVVLARKLGRPVPPPLDALVAMLFP